MAEICIHLYYSFIQSSNKKLLPGFDINSLAFKLLLNNSVNISLLLYIRLLQFQSNFKADDFKVTKFWLH